MGQGGTRLPPSHFSEKLLPHSPQTPACLSATVLLSYLANQFLTFKNWKVVCGKDEQLWEAIVITIYLIGYFFLSASVISLRETMGRNVALEAGDVRRSENDLAF